MSDVAATLSNTMLSKEDRNSALKVGEYVVKREGTAGNASLTAPILTNLRKRKRNEQAMPARSPLKIHNAISQLQ